MSQTDCQHVPRMELLPFFLLSPLYLSQLCVACSTSLTPGRSGDGSKAESDPAQISPARQTRAVAFQWPKLRQVSRPPDERHARKTDYKT
ncbi:hypothetical protein JG688_00006340 [Phytophthora aleatoria]|uniref:Secreted protein n=1 Tax=Phytophthora aleatoria TaxID=2496075 RepID=A0A8J5JBG7_9STRA|nr:hypothetical protein JG688_00006340 [Phytophthora aleatoria]